jgi:hypothetical protein
MTVGIGQNTLASQDIAPQDGMSEYRVPGQTPVPHALEMQQPLATAALRPEQSPLRFDQEAYRVLRNAVPASEEQKRDGIQLTPEEMRRYRELIAELNEPSINRMSLHPGEQEKIDLYEEETVPQAWLVQDTEPAQATTPAMESSSSTADAPHTMEDLRLLSPEGARVMTVEIARIIRRVRALEMTENTRG